MGVKVNAKALTAGCFEGLIRVSYRLYGTIQCVEVLDVGGVHVVVLKEKQTQVR